MTTRTQNAARAGGDPQFIDRGRRHPHHTRTVLGNAVPLHILNPSTCTCEPHTSTGTDLSGIVRLHASHSPLCPASNGAELAR